MELVINTDGGARGNPGPAAVGVVFKEGEWFSTYSQVLGTATNNVAEYMAVKLALEEWPRLPESKSLEIDRVQFYLDSQLVVMQIMGKYKVKEPHLQILHRDIKELLNALRLPYAFSYVPRAQNSMADSLVNQALDAAA